jgi:cell division protein FtsA
VRSPMYATAVGLVRFGFSQAQGKSGSRFRIRDESIFKRVKQRMRDWFYADFE